ncbi:hypothetical protein SUGI_0436390 [Cryptomeria japonica]|nr:hypothetical protein SUGI_0436390 [Cryptomeria japonica]
MATIVSKWPPAAGEWPCDVDEILQKGKQAVSDVGMSMRVPEAQVNSKAEAYIPQMVSLDGKLKKATDKNPEIIKRLFTDISKAPMISEFEQIYHRRIEEEDIPEFTWMMMVDALFLYDFLWVFTSHNIMPAKESIMCDIMKLENQIPLSLLKEVEKVESNASDIESRIGSLCWTLFHVGNSNIKMEKGKHLLGYMHKCISSILELQSEIVEEKWALKQWVLG